MAATLGGHAFRAMTTGWSQPAFSVRKLLNAACGRAPPDDRNTNPGTGTGLDDDCLDSGGSAAYFYHQDANYRVVMLTDEAGEVLERYEYTPHGEPRV